jgi:hypothetical protein
VNVDNLKPLLGRLSLRAQVRRIKRMERKKLRPRSFYPQPLIDIKVVKEWGGNRDSDGQGKGRRPGKYTVKVERLHAGRNTVRYNYAGDVVSK